MDIKKKSMKYVNGCQPLSPSFTHILGQKCPLPVAERSHSHRSQLFRSENLLELSSH